jgi:hypothetical protein
MKTAADPSKTARDAMVARILPTMNWTNPLTGVILAWKSGTQITMAQGE